jgi:hypothetical protein
MMKLSLSESALVLLICGIFGYTTFGPKAVWVCDRPEFASESCNRIHAKRARLLAEAKRIHAQELAAKEPQ